jgi:hypothetical protein
MNKPRSWIAELLVDFVCIVLGINLDDLEPNRPTTQIPWYISAIFCFAVCGLVVGGYLIWIWFQVR